MIGFGDLTVVMDLDLDGELVDLVAPFWEEKLRPTAEREVKRGAPVDSGELRDKAYAVVDRSGDELALLIGSEAEHFPFVEFGTGDTEPQPFARQAANLTIRQHLG